jgi:hypothetical protein
MYERSNRAAFIDAILQHPPAELSGGPVWMGAKFLQQNLGQIFAVLAPRQDHKRKQVRGGSTNWKHVLLSRQRPSGEILQYLPDVPAHLPHIMFWNSSRAEAIADGKKRTVQLGNLGGGRIVIKIHISVFTGGRSL